jgi:two-component system cell cycle sensor histidine kinase PleC
MREEVPPRPRAPQSAGSSPPPNDLETLREIARRIRQGSARLSAGADLPANEDGAPEVRAPAPEPPRDDQVSAQHAHLAHEIRTPLAAIVSLAEVITEERLGPWPNDRYRAYVRDILESARHGLEVVDGILRDRPSQPGATRVFAEVDLNAEVDAINTSLQPLAEKSGARLEVALTGGLPHVIADRRNVRQMLLNLISNCIKHGGPSVRIKVTTGYELSGEVWVEVEDNGPGMPSAEKSAPPPAAPRTTGLGLPLTRSLAGANGARLDIRSRAGRGVRARLVFSGDRSAAR